MRYYPPSRQDFLHLPATVALALTMSSTPMPIRMKGRICDSDVKGTPDPADGGFAWAEGGNNNRETGKRRRRDHAKECYFRTLQARMGRNCVTLPRFLSHKCRDYKGRSSSRPGCHQALPKALLRPYAANAAATTRPAPPTPSQVRRSTGPAPHRPSATITNAIMMTSAASDNNHVQPAQPRGEEGQRKGSMEGGSPVRRA